MRFRTLVWVMMAGLFWGCDPAGLRRVQLQMPAASSGSSTLGVDSPDVQQALRLLDTVVLLQGFRPTLEQAAPDYIRVYTLSRSRATVEGRSYSRDVHIQVRKTPIGIEVAFGEFGFLGGTPEPAVRAFKDVRAAFVKRYGKKHVRTKTFGSSNYRAGVDAGIGTLLAFGCPCPGTTQHGRWGQA